MTTSDDPGSRMDDLRAEIAAQHLGDSDLGERLKGENVEQLRADAERLREEARISGSGRPTPQAAFWLFQEKQRAMHERLFGKSAP